jgi:hypothetical protein
MVFNSRSELLFQFFQKFRGNLSKDKEDRMSLRKRLREAEDKYPDVDVFIRGGVLYIDGIPEAEFTEKTLSSGYFLPRDEFSMAYELEEPPEWIQKKGMADAEVAVGKRKRERR